MRTKSVRRMSCNVRDILICCRANVAIPIRSFEVRSRASATGKTNGDTATRGDTALCPNPSELEARWRAPAFTKDILRMVGIGKLDFSTPLHAIMLFPSCPVSPVAPWI